VKSIAQGDVMNQKQTRFEKSLDELPEDIVLNFKKKKWGLKSLILYLLKENKRLSKSQKTQTTYYPTDYFTE